MYEKINNNLNNKAYFTRIKCKSFSQSDKHAKKMFENKNEKLTQQPNRIAIIIRMKSENFGFDYHPFKM